jgi:hypothetical protein
MTRWVPAPERRERTRPHEPPRPAELQAYRSLLDPAHQPNGRGGWKLVRQGAMGLALVGVAGWLWKSASAEASSSARATADGPADKAGGGRAEKERS